MWFIIKGSWQEVNGKRQQVNNMTLILGSLFFLSGLAGVSYSKKMII